MSVKIKLGYPLKQKSFFNTVEMPPIEILLIKRPTVDDMAGLDFSPDKANASMAILITKLTALDLKEVKKMDLSDYMKISTVINNMIQGKINE